MLVGSDDDTDDEGQFDGWRVDVEGDNDVVGIWVPANAGLGKRNEWLDGSFVSAMHSSNASHGGLRAVAVIYLKFDA